MKSKNTVSKMAENYPKENEFYSITTKRELYELGLRTLIKTVGYKELLRDIRQRHEWGILTKKQAFDLRLIIKNCKLENTKSTQL